MGVSMQKALEALTFVLFILAGCLCTILGALIAGIVAMLISTSASAYTPSENLKLLSPTKVSIEYFDIINNRDDYLQINDLGSDRYGESAEYWKYGAAAVFNLDVAKYGQYGLYWNNNVHMDATNVAVRHVGWEWEIGTHVGPHFDTFYYHHSRHLMEGVRDTRFPLINRYGIRFILIEEGRK